MKTGYKSFSRKIFAPAAIVVALAVSLSAPGFCMSDQDAKFLDRLIAAEGKSTQAEFDRLAKLVEANQKDPRARFALAYCYEQKGYEQLAIDEFKRVSELRPDYPEVHFKLLTLLLAVSDIDGAADEVVTCEELFAKDGKGLLRIAQIVEHYGDEEFAGDLYEKAANAQQHALGAGTALAKVRNLQARYQDALTAADKDLLLDKNYGPAHAVKGLALDKLKRSRESMQEYLLAYKSAPYEKGVSTKIAEKLISEKRYSEAVRPALVSLAGATETINEQEDAKKVLINLLDKVPEKDSDAIVQEVGSKIKNSTDALYFRLSMGEVYKKLRRPTRAIGQYKICTTYNTSPTDENSNANLLARALTELGKLEELQLGNYDQAAVYYKQAEKVYPYNTETKEALQRLKRRSAAKENDLAWDIKESLRKLWQSMSGLNR